MVEGGKGEDGRLNHLGSVETFVPGRRKLSPTHPFPIRFALCFRLIIVNYSTFTPDVALPRVFFSSL